MARLEFREAALEKLSSPDQLDDLMVVTTRKGWLALIGALATIGAALAWGFLGNAPDNVYGTGILMHEGGFFGVEAQGTGIIDEMLVDIGDDVAVGQLIARIAQPVLDEEIREAEARLFSLDAERAMIKAQSNDALALRLQSIEENLDRLVVENESLRDQEAFLVRRLEAERKGVDSGLFIADVPQRTSQELSGVRAQLIANAAQHTDLEGTATQARNRVDQEGIAWDFQVDEARRQLDLLQTRRADDEETRSAHAGRVTGLLVNSGDAVREGAPLLTVEPTAGALRALLFVPLEGSRLDAEMPVRLSPHGIAWEEYGYMVGQVLSVSEAPVSPAEMNRILRNPALVEQFSAGGVVYLVTVALEVDGASPSGFRWTSRAGPETRIGSGALLSAHITVESRAPIELVIPALRGWLES